ncbi:MAG: hypothetical protein KDK37_04450 [Leptospiraceae bacterium]|nr:hypothetical protein [Leptospiraceae bacterium]
MPQPESESPEKSWLSQLFDLPERDFLESLLLKAREGNRLEPVFPWMVFYNVTLYALRNLWSARFQELKKEPRLVGFAANESGWKGRLENLRSVVDPQTGSATLDKAFVMGAAAVFLCRTEDPSSLALVFADYLVDPALEKTVREDPESVFRWPEGELLHFRVKGQTRVSPQAIQLIPTSKYKQYGLRFMQREITGLSCIAAGLLQSANQDFELDLDEMAVQRSSGRIRRETVEQSRQVIRRLCETQTDLHPLWKRLNSMY